jgi:hyperosmotically inducible periplasmic protein
MRSKALKGKCIMKNLSIIPLVILGAFCGCRNETRGPADTDNTAINERDRRDSAVTPFDQKENQSDVDVTAEIRSRIVDTDMSVNARNVKIITQGGKVTLRGPVQSETERQQIETIAVSIAGEGNVTNEIEINRQ